MKLSILIGVLALATGLPLESQALVLQGGPGAGMQNAATMSNFAANVSSASVVNAGVGSGVVLTPGNFMITPNISVPNINIPTIPGFNLPEIIIPDIGISGFPKITIPPSSGAGGNELQQSGTGNVANQVINHSTSIVQPDSGAGTSTVIVNNADRNQLRQNSVP